MVTNRNLDVSPRVEPRTLVDRTTLEEYTLHRIDRLVLPVAPDGVDHLNDRAIQLLSEAVGRVLRQFDAACRSESREVAVCGANLFHSGGRREIQAQPKRYHRANHKRLLDFRGAAFPSLAGEVETTKRVGFPEIDPRTQPVIIIIALLERLASKNSLANGFVAAVVAENETRSELMQTRTGQER